jgi:hypothetical protein
MIDQLFTGRRRNHADLSLISSRPAQLVNQLGDRLALIFEALPCYLGEQFDTDRGANSFVLKSVRWLSDLAIIFSFFTGSLIRCTIGLFASLVDMVAAPCRRTLFGIGSSVLSMIILPAILLLSLGQRMMLLQSPLGRLSPADYKIAGKIFGNRRWLAAVRIIRVRYGLFGTVSSSFVLGNLVILKSGSTHILIHELVHVWQYRYLGARYAGNALLAQWKFGRNTQSGNAYDWKIIAAETRSRWLALNAEAGAQLIEDTYEFAGAILSNQQHSELIKDAYFTILGKRI